MNQRKVRLDLNLSAFVGLSGQRLAMKARLPGRSVGATFNGSMSLASSTERDLNAGAKHIGSG